MSSCLIMEFLAGRKKRSNSLPLFVLAFCSIYPFPPRLNFRTTNSSFHSRPHATKCFQRVFTCQITLRSFTWCQLGISLRCFWFDSIKFSCVVHQTHECMLQAASNCFSNPGPRRRPTNPPRSCYSQLGHGGTGSSHHLLYGNHAPFLSPQTKLEILNHVCNIDGRFALDSARTSRTTESILESHEYVFCRSSYR